MLVNLRNIDWTCICKQSGCVFYFDSQHGPVVIEEAEWQRIITLHPDLYLVVRADSDYE